MLGSQHLQGLQASSQNEFGTEKSLRSMVIKSANQDVLPRPCFDYIQGQIIRSPTEETSDYLSLATSSFP